MDTETGPNPSGLCLCGCGHSTQRSEKTYSRKNIKKGEFGAYVSGHGSRTRDRSLLGDPNPDGFCLCGCGEVTPLSKRDDFKRGISKGNHMLYASKGHAISHAAAHRMSDRVDPNPSGLCFCGCGEKTPLASVTQKKIGTVKGKHLKWVDKSHQYFLDPDWRISEIGCWRWLGPINPSGYGTFKGNYAHVWAFETYVSPIVSGLTIDHLCRVRDCVNPDHLEMVTQGENNKRAWARYAIENRRRPDVGKYRQKENRWVLEENTGCWIWRCALNENGYGLYKDNLNKKTYQAHRWVFEQYKGKIPAGLQLDHLCFNRWCVNPEHLEPVTPAENT